MGPFNRDTYLNMRPPQWKPSIRAPLTRGQFEFENLKLAVRAITKWEICGIQKPWCTYSPVKLVPRGFFRLIKPIIAACILRIRRQPVMAGFERVPMG